MSGAQPRRPGPRANPGGGPMTADCGTSNEAWRRVKEGGAVGLLLAVKPLTAPPCHFPRRRNRAADATRHKLGEGCWRTRPRARRHRGGTRGRQRRRRPGDRGREVRRRERRMKSWWRHEQASVRMAMITAGHHSYRRATGIKIGVQAGTPLFHNFDMESDDTDPR